MSVRGRQCVHANNHFQNFLPHCFPETPPELLQPRMDSGVLGVQQNNDTCHLFGYSLLQTNLPSGCVGGRSSGTSRMLVACKMGATETAHDRLILEFVAGDDLWLELRSGLNDLLCGVDLSSVAVHLH